MLHVWGMSAVANGKQACTYSHAYTLAMAGMLACTRRLEALLEEKLSAVGRVGAASQGFAATQMRVEAHRQVFDAFLHSFTTYRSLLLRIKHEYDVALDDALASVYDNVHMRAELAVAEERLVSRWFALTPITSLF